MKIGIIGSRGIPNNYGGYEQFATFLSQALVERGHDVYVYNSHLHPYRKNDWNGVKIIHCNDPENKLGTAGQFFYDRNCLSDASKRNFDILLHLGYTSDSIWHRRWPRNSVNIVNMDGIEWRRSKYNRVTRWFLKKAERLAAIYGDVLVADSTAIQEYIKNTYKKESHYIPYAAEVFETPDIRKLEKFQVQHKTYYMLIARMVPENNIETIIKGWLLSQQAMPLLIVGDTGTRFGKYLVSKYQAQGIIYAGAVFDNELLDNLRYYSVKYFHGHSVGGTNPSLLEAMACGCSIIAHENVFNKAILGDEADYFKDEHTISRLLVEQPNTGLQEIRQKSNLEKITSLYSKEKIVKAYEHIMLEAFRKKKEFSVKTPR